MSEPTTKAGRRLVSILVGAQLVTELDVALIEAEARAQLRAEIAEGVEGLDDIGGCELCPEWQQYPKSEHPVALGDLGTHFWRTADIVSRAAVLALIRGEEPAQDWTVEAADARIAAADASSPGPQEAE